ncbi:hypothetical protein diail_8716 [Diaporthe ilicicola]|nr:hypothetical protein diail_8716 [Diaporthe ilicicola]
MEQPDVGGLQKKSFFLRGLSRGRSGDGLQLSRSEASWLSCNTGKHEDNQKTIKGKNPLPSQTENDQTEWEVEKILDVQKRGNRRVRVKWAHVKWAHFDNPTWEPLKEILRTEALLAYENEHGQIVP